MMLRLLSGALALLFGISAYSLQAAEQHETMVWHISIAEPDSETTTHAAITEGKSEPEDITDQSPTDTTKQGMERPVAAGGQTTRTQLSMQYSSASPLSNQQAEAWLDYKLYDRVEAGMRARLKVDAYDGAAWRLLADSLTAQGRVDEALQARQRSRQYGDGQRSWHMSFRLGGLVDSNVVIAPDAVHLAAQDQGDIGGRVALTAYGRLWQQDWGYTAWQLRYDDMLYQDFNTFAVRKLKAALSQHVVWGDDIDVSLGLKGEQASLGGNSFYAGWQTTTSLNMPVGKQMTLGVAAAFGRRNFASGFSDFSAWRWHVSPHVAWSSKRAQAGADILLAKEQTRLGVEAYRQLGGGVSAAWQAFDWGEQGELWLQGRGGLVVRAYQQLDSRAFLKLPVKRKDTELTLVGAVAWQRPTTLWGGGIAEIWQLQAGWQRNSSNMDVLAVFDPAQAREWKRWWSEVSVQWAY